MLRDHFDLTGKCVLVTGGSRGLGLAMVKACAEYAADLVIASRNLETCEAAAQAVRALGRRALPYACHMGHWDEIPGLVDAAYDAFGKVDVLINNAGMGPALPAASDYSEGLFDKIVCLNFKGPFRLSALVGERMAAAGGGSIINISSTASMRPTRSWPVHAGAKSALNIMTQAHAFEFGPNAPVNAIVCSPFWTDISKDWREQADKTSTAAVRRIGRPHAIATTALYLASDHSSFTTASVIRLDGGQY
jgi:NAD(P)-dependent dehydrogenase (short-subunit alcohol dehydrogenase family)